MSTDSRTPDPPPDRDASRKPGRETDVAALVRSIEQTAQEKEQALGAKRQERRSRVWHVLLVLGVLANAYLWIGQPAWLGLGGSGTPTVEEEEGMLRYRMYVEARRIDAFQREHGEPPESLEALGSSTEGLHYRRTGPDGWELMGEEGRASLVLHSAQPLDDFIGVGAPGAQTVEVGSDQP